MTVGRASRRRQAIDWADVPARLRARGLRWTPQRRVLLEVLAGVDGHVTGAALVDRCRAIDPSTTPSTVYRTLDLLEELGVVIHSHGADGREEFHVRTHARHGHLRCVVCGGTWDLGGDEVRQLADRLRKGRGFEVALEHLTVEGRCAACGSARA